VVGASTSVAVSSTLRSRPPLWPGSGSAPPGRAVGGAAPARSVPAVPSEGAAAPAGSAGGVPPRKGNGWVTGQPTVTEVAGTVVAVVVEVAPVPVVAGEVVAGTVVVGEAPDAAASSRSSWAAWPGASAAALSR
jgi:hypothetical protein